MTAAVLDASALLALILGEPGGEKVQRVLTDCAMTAVNLGEVVGHFARIGSPEAEIRLMLDPLPFVRVALDEELAFIAGLMFPATVQAGLSFGDRACLALANKLGVRALTADHAWQRIAVVVGVEVDLIRGAPH
jgi:PIN domain nuclease of toxin-antitoxin system